MWIEYKRHGARSREQRAESRELRAESRGQKKLQVIPINRDKLQVTSYRAQFKDNFNLAMVYTQGSVSGHLAAGQSAFEGWVDIHLFQNQSWHLA